MSVVKTLKKKTGSNYIPFNFAYVVERDDVDTVPAATSNFATPGAATYRIATDIELVATKVFQSIDLNKANAKFNEVLVEGDSEYYDATATAFYPEIDENAIAIANTYVGVEGVFVIKFINGTMRVMGNKDNPAKITKFNEDSTKGGFDIEFKWSGPDKCPFYTGAITL